MTKRDSWSRRRRDRQTNIWRKRMRRRRKEKKRWR